jgi:hypothetical protein
MKAVTEGRGGEAGANVIRDTPGRLLMAWALLFSSLVLLSWRLHVHRAEYDWLVYPTALGDRSYYGIGEGGGLGANDFFEANLRAGTRKSRQIEPIRCGAWLSGE